MIYGLFHCNYNNDVDYLQIQPNKYAAFYDHAQQNWSVMFETDAQLSQFVKQVH